MKNVSDNISLNAGKIPILYGVFVFGALGAGIGGAFGGAAGAVIGGVIGGVVGFFETIFVNGKE